MESAPDPDLDPGPYTTTHSLSPITDGLKNLQTRAEMMSSLRVPKHIVVKPQTRRGYNGGPILNMAAPQDRYQRFRSGPTTRVKKTPHRRVQGLGMTLVIHGIAP